MSINKAASMEDALADNFIQEEEPAAVETIAEETPIDLIPEPEAEAENAIQEKVVEKIVEVETIVEKYPDMSEYSQQMLKAIQEGNEDQLYDYLREKKRDYQVMSDYDVVQAGLKLTNPKWSDKDIQIELKSKYGTIAERKDLNAIDQENFPEEYDKAVAFNERIDEKELLLSRDARDFRYSLEEQKKNVEFPKITSPTPVNKEPTPEEIAEENRVWEQHVDSALNGFSEIKFKVGNEEGSYQLTDEEKSESLSFLRGYTDASVLYADLGWMDKDGNENLKKIAEDRLRLKQFDKMQSLTQVQTKTQTIKDVISKDIKNINLDGRSTSAAVVAKSFADAALDA